MRWGFTQMSSFGPTLFMITLHFFILNHYLACAWMLLHRHSGTRPPAPAPAAGAAAAAAAAANIAGAGGVGGGGGGGGYSLQTWATADGLATWNVTTGAHSVCDDDYLCYVRAAYYTLVTLSTVGYGDIKPQTDTETAFQLCVVLSGATIFATLIALFTQQFVYSSTAVTNVASFQSNMRTLR
jgi:hypothetical protein